MNVHSIIRMLMLRTNTKGGKDGLLSGRTELTPQCACFARHATTNEDNQLHSAFTCQAQTYEMGDNSFAVDVQ